MKRIVLIAGFESFNADLYRKAAHLAQQRCPELDIRVFSDRSLTTEPAAVEAALKDADVSFGSLIFDYDQVIAHHSIESVCRSQGLGTIFERLYPLVLLLYSNHLSESTSWLCQRYLR